MKARLGVIPILFAFTYMAIPFSLGIYLSSWVKQYSLWLSFAAIFAGYLCTVYVYKAAIRHYLRRMYQAKIRKMAMSEKKGYLLFSRSFDQTLNRSLVQGVHIPNVGPLDYNLLEVIAHYLSKKYPLVAMGDKDILPEYRASDALVISEIENGIVDWSKVFLALAQNAQGIIVIPGVTKGFMHEVGMIRAQGLLRKTFFFMWPSPGHYSDPRLCHDPSKWKDANVQLASYGFQIPEYIPEGAFFQFDDTLKLIKVEKLQKMKSIADPFGNLTMPAGTAPLKDMLPAIYAAEYYSNDDKANGYWHQVNYSAQFRKERNKFAHAITHCEFLFTDNTIKLAPNVYLTPKDSDKTE